MGQQVAINPLQRRRDRQKPDGGVDRDGVAQLLEPGGRQDGGAPALDHVRQQGGANLAPNAGHLVFGFRTLDEHDVGPGLRIQLAAGNGLVQSQRGAGVGAGDDQEVTAFAGGNRDLDLQRHLGSGYHPAARRVAALLGRLLILDLDRRHAGGLVAGYGVPDVQQAAIPGVGIGDDRRAAYPGERADTADHVGIGCQAHVG